MIKSLPDVSHLRYRGGRVEWRGYRPGAEYHLAVPGSGVHDYLVSIYGGPWLWSGVVYASANSGDRIGFVPQGANAADVAKEAILRLLANGVVTEVDQSADVFVLSPELLALASAVAQRRGQSLDDFLTSVIESKVVSIAVVDYRDDPEIRRLHINLAESWGKE